MKFAPWDCRRFRLTNRRVIIEKGFNAEAERSLPLEQFDAIDVNVLPGQEWYPCGELIFRNGRVETLRLSGVPRPETFRPHLSESPALAHGRATCRRSRSHLIAAYADKRGSVAAACPRGAKPGDEAPQVIVAGGSL